MEPNRDYSFLQTGGDPETLAALMRAPWRWLT